MWCCASKPQTKKPLRSARQQPLQKVTLNLPPMIRLEYKKKWQGKIDPTSNQKVFTLQKPQKQKSAQNPEKMAELKKKIQQAKSKKKQLQETLNKQTQKGEQLQEGLDKMEAISTVLRYMILKEEQKIDGFVLKIKS